MKPNFTEEDLNNIRNNPAWNGQSKNVFYCPSFVDAKEQAKNYDPTGFEKNYPREYAELVHSQHENSRLIYEIENLRHLMTSQRRIYQQQLREAEGRHLHKFTLALWRKIISFCHPDKNNNSPDANEVTRWLLENKPNS